MNEGGGSVRSCFGIEVRADASKLMNTLIAGFGNRRIWSEKDKCLSERKPRLRAKWVVLSDDRGVLDFAKLLGESDEQEFSLGGVES